MPPSSPQIFSDLGGVETPLLQPCPWGPRTPEPHAGISACPSTVPKVPLSPISPRRSLPRRRGGRALSAAKCHTTALASVSPPAPARAGALPLAPSRPTHLGTGSGSGCSRKGTGGEVAATRPACLPGPALPRPARRAQGPAPSPPPSAAPLPLRACPRSLPPRWPGTAARPPDSAKTDPPAPRRRQGAAFWAPHHSHL